MSKAPRRAPKKPKKSSPKQYDKPLSLYPLDFSEAVERLLGAKPQKKAKKK